MTDGSSQSRTQATARCPICRKRFARSEPTYPFCSERCKLVDLGKWLDGDYLISRPIEQSDLDEE